jgi:hypothetical protein
MAETVLDAAAPRLRPQAPWQASRGGPGKNHEGLALGGTSPLDLEDGLRPKLPQRQRPRKAVAQKKRLAPGPQGRCGGPLFEHAGDGGKHDAGNDRGQHRQQEWPAHGQENAFSFFGQPVAHEVHAGRQMHVLEG